MTPADKDAAVLRVLRTATEPLGPTRIGEMVNAPWSCGEVNGYGCRLGRFGFSAAIVPICRRIGAVRHAGGKYTAPLAKD